MNTYDAIISGIMVIWLSWCVQQFIKIIHGFRTQVYYCSNELYYATKAMTNWMDEGKLKPHRHLEITSHLVKLAGRDVDIGFSRLRLIAGPNGWTVYQALLAKRNLWKRLLIRTWNR